MPRSRAFVSVAVLILAASGCNSGPHAAAGFRLPSSGDAERGKSAFLAHQCYNCHTVDGVEMPPAALVPKAVALGGALHHQITDGYLVTSIINPSHVLSGYARSNAAAPEGGLRMPDYSSDLTVAELTDLVAFLQSRYSVQTAPRYPNTL